jgi:hypothetical protein
MLRCRYRDDYFECQFPHWQAGYFSLLFQRKVSKINDPRMPLVSCASRIYRGLPEGTSCPSGNVRHPCHTPNGLFPINAPMLGAAYGSGAIAIDQWPGFVLHPSPLTAK